MFDALSGKCDFGGTCENACAAIELNWLPFHAGDVGKRIELKL